MAIQIQLRGDTAAAWTSANPILAVREMGVETDTRKFKFGDGVTHWVGLSYASSGGGGAAVWGGITGDLADQTDLVAALDAKVPTTTTVNGHALSANVTVTAGDVGLGSVDNTSDANKPVSTAQAAADAAVLAFAVQRANHTGTQLAATISDFSAAADARVAAGLVGYATTAAVTSADAAVLSTAEAYADSLVVGLLDDRGNFNASGNTFPATGGSGAAGAILKGDLWTISVAGTLGGHPVTAGDVVRALVDSPGSTDSNWAIGENNFGYVAENSANKNASGGYAGLTLFKLNLLNALGTVTSWFTTAATVARTWTMPDKDGTVAMTSDITGTNSGTNTGDETGARVATLLHAATAKTTLVDADEVNGTNSANSFSLIRTVWSDVWTYIKSKADAVYAIKGAITGSALTMATGKLLGRNTASTGAIEEITLGTGLSMTGTTLNAAGGSPGGSTTQVQYNSSGAFAGSSNLTWANGSQTLSVGNTGTLDGGNQLNFASNAKALRMDTNGIYPTTGDGGLNLGYIGGGFSFGSLTLTGSIRAGSVSKTSNYTATTSDSTIAVDASGGAVTITGYACASHAGRILIIKKTDSSGNAVTFDPNASETVDGASTKATSTQYGGFIVQVNAAATAWNVIGTF